MTYTIEDIKGLLKTYPVSKVAEILGISVVKMNETIKAVSAFQGITPVIKNPPFNLTKGGNVILGSSDEDAPNFDIAVVREMLISTEKAKVAETLGISTVLLNRVIAEFPQDLDNLPKAVKLPFTILDDSGNPLSIVIDKKQPVEDSIPDPEPSGPSIIEYVSEIPVASSWSDDSLDQQEAEMEAVQQDQNELQSQTGSVGIQ